MDFAQSLSLYENSRDVLSRLEKLPQSSTRDQVETENYLPMYSSSNPDYELMRAPENPENAEYHEMALMSAGDRSSLYSSNYDIVDSMALMSDTRFDTIKHAPKNFIKIDDETFMYKPEKEISLPDNAGTGISLQEQSLDQLSISLQGTNLFSGYVTIPRSKVSDSIHNLSKSQECFRFTIKSAKTRNLENLENLGVNVKISNIPLMLPLQKHSKEEVQI